MFGAKVNNLLLGEKNLVDFVDKNLGQERERLTVNELQMEQVCHHLCGGSSSLDYPRLISHDFCDIVSAFDIYIQSFTRDETLISSSKGCGIFQRDQPEIKNERMSKMPFKGSELSERQFLNAFFQAAVKIRTHLIDCLDETTTSGRLENLLCIISNVAIIRNYIWVFRRIFNTDTKTAEKLKAESDEFGDLLESTCDRMVQCHMNLLTTYIIHDEQSQNWSSVHSYYEGQRASPTIQMWNYFLKVTRNDTWKILPPQLAQRVLGIIVNDSLTTLAGRYSRIDPSEEMKSQFCVDIINILETIHEFLFHMTTTMEEFCGDIDPTSEVIFTIHQKCNCLSRTLLLVGAPLEVLYKSFRRGLAYFSFPETGSDNAHLEKPIWMQVLYRLCVYKNFYPSVGSTKWELVSNFQLLCGQPTVNWSLLYKVIALNDFCVASLILQLFPSVLVTPTYFLLEGNGFQTCGQAGCFSNCHALPKSMQKYHVTSSIFYILAHTIPRKWLADLFRTLHSQIEDWTVMDRAQVWTSTKRPIWFQCLIDLLLPILKTCVQELCLHLFGRQDENTTQLVIRLLNSTADLLSIIPRSFFLICEEIDDLIPSSIYPVRNSVPVHLMVTTLYQLLNIGPGIIVSADEEILKFGATGESSLSQEVRRENHVKSLLPILFSVSERLCHLDDPAFDQTLHRMTSQIDSMMRQTLAESGKTPIQKLPFIVTDDLATLKVNFLLEELEGQIALWTVYWFLVTNSEAIHGAIFNRFPSATGVSLKTVALVVKNPVSKPPRAHSSKVAPAPTRIDTKSSEPKPLSLSISAAILTYYRVSSTVLSFHYVNVVRTFNEILWNLQQNLDWVSTIRHCKMGLHRHLILRHLQRRPDFQSVNSTTAESTTDASSSEKSILLHKMITEITALLSVKSN